MKKRVYFTHTITCSNELDIIAMRMLMKTMTDTTLYTPKRTYPNGLVTLEIAYSSSISTESASTIPNKDQKVVVNVSSILEVEGQ